MVMAKDACYTKVKGQYKDFPSARASQAIAKCRKKKGQVRKTEKGKSLKRWEKEEWKNDRGKDCGDDPNKKGYCRPTKKVSKSTPKTRKQLTTAQKAAAQRRKSLGLRAPTYSKRS
jgi:hypothetical protein